MRRLSLPWLKTLCVRSASWSWPDRRAAAIRRPPRRGLGP